MHITQPRTEALRRALAAARSEPLIRDLLYLEAWEMAPEPGAGPALRIHQLRRANPELAAAIRAELSSPRRARD
jgi:DNA-binding SARP family transcriptional activator